MPRGSQELTAARREEIVDACAELYRTMGFNEITLRDIGEKTSFGRTAIYNYFQTKEEIFLALLCREYGLWTDDLAAIGAEGGPLGPEGFADALAQTLEKRGCMLKLLCMNLYDMEGASRLENLARFKAAYRRALETLDGRLAACFPAMGAQDRQGFCYAFFPFLFGVYPYAAVTEKQKKAMEMAGLRPSPGSIHTLVSGLARQLLAPWGAAAQSGDT